MKMFVFFRERSQAFTLLVCILSIFMFEMIIILTEPDYMEQVNHIRGTKTDLIRNDRNHVSLGGNSFTLKNASEESETNNFATWIPRASENNKYSGKGVQEILRNISSIHGKQTIGASPTIRVGFFEGYRRYWTYNNIFQPPDSPRTCECDTFKADVVLEKNPEKTGKFDLLFIPQDHGFTPLERGVWNTILSSATSSQKRIYATFEGPNKLRKLAWIPPFLRNKRFHWSWTFHSQSDFTMPYGVYILKPNNTFISQDEKKTERNWSEGKASLLAWMSTWSQTSWKREEFAIELQKHIPIDFFGQKFKNCPRNSKKCEQKIRKYKFYLALENSCCSEYITEKFWRTLDWDIVPIVVGAPRDDYERLAPPHSFIHADDYDSIQDLVKHIMYLDKNDDHYNEYFRWKEEGEVIVKYPPIENLPVKHNIPPSTFFYSCNAVCRVGKRYLNEQPDKEIGAKVQNLSTDSYFEPKVDWWCGSCIKCGLHEWISKYNN